mmetsp:Transcript_5606/g.22150  ORF Transcript_5606/g.22150 Transcript_5606/m.22150 type:complete len:81 (+) Transcript_5606:1429-1671(+)
MSRTRTTYAGTEGTRENVRHLNLVPRASCGTQDPTAARSHGERSLALFSGALTFLPPISVAYFARNRSNVLALSTGSATT